MGKLYDCIIIGSGPAGLTAAIYAARACLSVLVLEKEFVSGGQVVNTYEVDNYPGYRGISGFDLGMKFREHAEKLDVEFVMETVERVDLEKDEIQLCSIANNRCNLLNRSADKLAYYVCQNNRCNQYPQ